MNQKPMPSARMVAPAPEEDDHPNPTEQSSREDSDSGESYAAIKEQPISTVEDGVSEVNLEVVLRVAHITEDMMGKCFHCGQGDHIGETLSDPCRLKPFFKLARGTCRLQEGRAGPQQQSELSSSQGDEPDQFLVKSSKIEGQSQMTAV